MIYEALIGEKPFGAQKIEDVFDNILNLKLIWPEIGYEEGMISPEAQGFIKGLLDLDYTKRLGCNGLEQIKQHLFWDDFDWDNIQKDSSPFKSNKSDPTALVENLGLRKEI